MQPEDQRSTDVRYTVIPRVLVFLTRGDEILLLLGAPDKKLWAGKYNGLGGHIEPGETPYQAAVREVQEEAGLIVEALTLRAVVHATLPEPPGVIFFVFVGEACPPENPGHLPKGHRSGWRNRRWTPCPWSKICRSFCRVC